MPLLVIHPLARLASAAATLALLPALRGWTAPAAPEAPMATLAAVSVTRDAPARRAPARHVGRARSGRFLGFDVSRYPGDRAMETWKDASPYHWAGYYLSAPCHHDDSWMGKRETLTEMGWGMAVIYVGQQDWARTPRGTGPNRPPRAGEHHPCSSWLVNAPQGGKEADDAVAITEAEGFPQGTTIYLDVERVHSFSPAMRGYVRAWIDRVLEDGRYVPALYGHASNARSMYDLAQSVYSERGVPGRPAFWLSTAAGFARHRAPSEVGYAFADVWQGQYEARETWGGTTLRVDANVSTTDSPSGAMGLTAADEELAAK
jgi:hypothetical protein